MTKAEKNFIQTYINVPWAVQQLTLVEDADSIFTSIDILPFRSIEAILSFGDIPFFIALNADLAYAYLPINSPQILKDLNQLLAPATGYYVAAITLPGLNINGMVTLGCDWDLQSNIVRLRKMVQSIQTYKSIKLIPEFSQSMLDRILDELKDKSFAELTPLKQFQLKHFSTFLAKSLKNNR